MAKKHVLKGGSLGNSVIKNSLSTLEQPMPTLEIILCIIIVGLAVYLCVYLYKPFTRPEPSVTIKNIIQTPQTDNVYSPPLSYIPMVNRFNPFNNGYSYSNEPYRQMGILTPTDDTETLILPLYGRYIQRDRFQYYSMSNTGFLNNKLPIISNKKNGLDEYGINEIYDGDNIYVKGYDATFRVTMY